MATGPDLTTATTTPDRRPTVLVADDEPDLRLMLRLALRRDGRFLVCAEADDGASAVGLASALQPDVVLLDLMMPVVDGWTALPRLQTVAPRSMIVVLSALDAERNADLTFARGAFAYLEKHLAPRRIPVEIEGLLASFRSGLSGQTVIAPSMLQRAGHRA